MKKEDIRLIIELFIAWNGWNDPIDISNLDSAVDFIYDSISLEVATEEGKKYMKRLLKTLENK